MAYLQRWLLNWNKIKKEDKLCKHLRGKHASRGNIEGRTCSRNKLDLLEKMEDGHYPSFSSPRCRPREKNLSAGSLLGDVGNTSRSAGKWHRERKAAGKGYVNKPATQWVTVLIPQGNAWKWTKHVSKLPHSRSKRVEVLMLQFPKSLVDRCSPWADDLPSLQKKQPDIKIQTLVNRK